MTETNGDDEFQAHNLINHINCLQSNSSWLKWRLCASVNYKWLKQWLVTWPAPSHCLNQCWNVANWTLWNKIQWNLNHKSCIFTHENAFENVVGKMAAIFSRPQYGKKHRQKSRCVTPFLAVDQAIQSQFPQTRTNSHSWEDIHHYEWQRPYISEPICQMTKSATP